MPFKSLFIIFWVVCSLTLSGCSALSYKSSDNYDSSQLALLNQQFQIDPDSARAQLHTLKQTAPNDTSLWITSGYWSLQENNIPRAKVAFQKAQQIENNNVEALMGLGLCADKIKDHGGAQSFYHRALLLEGDNLKLLNNLAVSYMLNKKPKKAVKYLSKAHSLFAPKYASADKQFKGDVSKPELEARIFHNLSLAFAMDNKLADARSIMQELVGVQETESRLETFDQLTNDRDR